MNTVLGSSDFVVLAVLVLIPLLVISAMVGVLARGSGANLKSREFARLARLETKVDLLLQHAGLAYDSNAEVLKHANVRAAAEKGDKIKATILYADATGIGLPDAKAAIDGVMARAAM
jgi:ribosomal protein L7/L12